MNTSDSSTNTSNGKPGLSGAAGSTSSVWHDGTWSYSELLHMSKGNFIDRNGKRYGMCQNCRRIIRADRTFFGSLHLCE